MAIRVKKEAGVLLISVLLKLTPLLCLLSLQTFHLIAITTELRRRDPALCYRLSVPGKNPELRCVNCCFRDCLSGIVEPVQPGFAMLITREESGDLLLFLYKGTTYYFTSIGSKFELKYKNRGPDPEGGEITDSCAIVFFQPWIKPTPLQI